MKKLFTILLVCTFAFSTVTFIGCGGDDAGTDTTEDSGSDDGGDDSGDDSGDDT